MSEEDDGLDKIEKEDLKLLSYICMGGQYPHWIKIGEPLREEVQYFEVKDKIILNIVEDPDGRVDFDEHTEDFMLHPNVTRWLRNVAGDNGWEFDGLYAVVKFKEKRHAMMFKLTWATGKA